MRISYDSGESMAAESQVHSGGASIASTSAPAELAQEKLELSRTEAIEMTDGDADVVGGSSQAPTSVEVCSPAFYSASEAMEVEQPPSESLFTEVEHPPSDIENPPVPVSGT